MDCKNCCEVVVIKNKSWLPFGYLPSLRMHGTPFFTRFSVLSFMGFESPMLHLNVTKKKPLLSSSGFFEVFVYINQ